MQLAGLTATLSGRHANDRFDIRLSAPAISLSDQRAGGSEIQLTFKVIGTGRGADGSVSVSALTGTRQALKIEKVTVTLDAKQGANAMRGRLTSPIEANLDAQTFALPQIAGEFELSTSAHPKPATLSLSGAARALLASEKAEVDLTGTLDESKFESRVSLARFAPPEVALKFTMDRLDVDRYLAKKTADAPTKPPPEPTSEAPIDLSPLKTLNMNGSVQVGQLTAAGVKASRVRAEIKARDGQIAIQPLSANLYEGTARGAVSIDAHRNRFAVKQNLSGVSVGPLLQDALSQNLLSGRGDIALDVTTNGQTVGALTRALSGSARLSLKDGAIKGINLAEALRKARNLVSAGQDVEGQAASGEQTDFSEFKASLAILEGKARNDDLSVKSPFLRLSGGGEIDLVQSALDYRVGVSLVASAKGQGGKELDELAGITIPVHVTGPLTAPKFKFELRDALRAGTERRLEEKKEALKEKLKGRLEERLGEPEAPAESDAGTQSPPPETREEEVKRKLKDLLRR
jgi:AsmA protein